GIFFEPGTEPSVSFTTDIFASEIEFVIKDETGSVVRTITQEDVAPGTGTLEWDGKDTIGNVAAEGYYTVEARATDASGNSFTPELSLVGIVTKITYRDGAAYLMVNGSEIAMGDVVSIGAPSDEDQP
ncbi:MAG: hypothetical protein KKA42_05060, partial [candidate division Zixibacteria bacterium]|nr:hypothetical protein [candidate division Zixibacteria bacterium]